MIKMICDDQRFNCVLCFYLRQIAELAVAHRYRNSVCPSVCLSQPSTDSSLGEIETRNFNSCIAISEREQSTLSLVSTIMHQ